MPALSLAKPFLFTPERGNDSYKLYFFSPSAVQNVFDRADEYNRALTLVGRSWLHTMEAKHANDPWIPVEPDTLPSQTLVDFTWKIRYEATNRNPVEGPSSLIWDQPRNTRNPPSLIAYYGERGIKDGLELDKIPACLQAHGVTYASLQGANVLYHGDKRQTNVCVLLFEAGSRNHCMTMRHDSEIGWYVDISADFIKEQINRGIDPSNIPYDPRILPPAAVAEAMGELAPATMVALAPHLPRVYGENPPVTWKL